MFFNYRAFKSHPYFFLLGPYPLSTFLHTSLHYIEIFKQVLCFSTTEPSKVTPTSFFWDHTRFRHFFTLLCIISRYLSRFYVFQLQSLQKSPLLLSFGLSTFLHTSLHYIEIFKQVLCFSTTEPSGTIPTFDNSESRKIQTFSTSQPWAVWHKANAQSDETSRHFSTSSFFFSPRIENLPSL